MKIRITLDTGNAAFDGHGCVYEVQRILNVWINKSVGYGAPMEAALVDANGSTVGRVELVEPNKKPKQEG